MVRSATGVQSETY